jgi:hypothetical protein
MCALRITVADNEAALGAARFTLVSMQVQTETCCHAPSRSSTFSTDVACRRTSGHSNFRSCADM